MSTLVYDVKYRPVRVGWCVRDGDLPSLVAAFRLSHCLWGGRFNPVIVIDNEASARHMIDLFHVDALLPIGADEACRKFSESINHLPWPGSFHYEFFEGDDTRKQCIFLDVHHPIRSFYEAHVEDKELPSSRTALLTWTEQDKCATAFEAQYGSYPTAADCGINYRQLVIDYGAGKELPIASGAVLDPTLLRAFTPSSLTKLSLQPEFGHPIQEPGLFVGSAASFGDLVDFWNLRAANIPLLFFDPEFGERFRPLVEELDAKLCSAPPHPQWGPGNLHLWLKRERDEAAITGLKAPLAIRPVKESTWDDRVWKGLKVTPPTMYFSSHEVVAHISEVGHGPMVTIQLQHKPGYYSPGIGSQRLVATIKPTLNFSQDHRFLFAAPNIPELNEHFGRKHHISWNEARAGRDGLGIITWRFTEHLTLWGMERFSMFEQLFKMFGIALTVRQPGLVCEQLVRQMGGLQGARVFKIAGVRKLIEQFGPHQTFTRSEAMRLIANVDSQGHADFTPYENLYLEPRGKGPLKPDDAFTYLLTKGVFRVGINLECTSCQLKFWRALDDVKTLVTCEYCGRDFNVSPQLKGEKWAYRPSGLFGRGDHQEGGLPVALTLQQLDTTTHSGCLSWLPAVNLEPITAPINACETDFVLLHQNNEGRVQLVIGECKASVEITCEDVTNLAKVADALPTDRFDVFIVFSKSGKEFTPEEIQRCKSADSPTKPRTILLSKRELEPYHAYELAEKEFSLRRRGGYLENMVEATRSIYFEPRPKMRPTRCMPAASGPPDN